MICGLRAGQIAVICGPAQTMRALLAKGHHHVLPPTPAKSRQSSLAVKLQDQARFLRQWAGNPLSIGAVAPSSPELASAMASVLDPGIAGRVLELGPGTGVVTQAILARGIAPSRVISVEYSQSFVALLAQRFPDIQVVRGDAYDLAALPLHGEMLAGVVSSLPLLTRHYDARRALIVDALQRLAPGAPFIQFSYALAPPVGEEPGRFTLSKTGWIWNNMPPARVWIYRKTTQRCPNSD